MSVRPWGVVVCSTTWHNATGGLPRLRGRVYMYNQFPLYSLFLGLRLGGLFCGLRVGLVWLVGWAVLAFERRRLFVVRLTGAGGDQVGLFWEPKNKMVGYDQMLPVVLVVTSLQATERSEGGSREAEHQGESLAIPPQFRYQNDTKVAVSQIFFSRHQF